MTEHESFPARVFNTLKENISDRTPLEIITVLWSLLGGYLENKYGEASYNRGKARFWAVTTGMGIAEIIRRSITFGEGFQPQQFFLIPEVGFTVLSGLEGWRLMRRSENIIRKQQISDLNT